MALLNVGDVVQGVATLLDDPGQTDIDADYVIPFLNLRWANLIVNLVMLGLQYSDEVAVFDIPANTLSLTNYMLAGQPLASMMQPQSIDWKPVGAPDMQYTPADSKRVVDDFPDGTQGIQQYAFSGGTVFVSPSDIPVTARVRFKAMSTTLVDPEENMIRGVGDIIAFRTAELIYSIRGNQALKVDMKTYGDTALDDFISMGVLRSQSTFYEIPPTHRCGPARGISMAPSLP